MFKKILNLFFFIIVMLFFVSIFKFYFSNQNIKDINLNRINNHETLKMKMSNIPILEDDTSQVVEFNSSFSEEIKNDQPRSFWNLLKFE